MLCSNQNDPLADSLIPPSLSLSLADRGFPTPPKLEKDGRRLAAEAEDAAEALDKEAARLAIMASMDPQEQLRHYKEHVDSLYGLLLPSRAPPRRST